MVGALGWKRARAPGAGLTERDAGRPLCLFRGWTVRSKICGEQSKNLGMKKWKLLHDQSEARSGGGGGGGGGGGPQLNKDWTIP